MNLINRQTCRICGSSKLTQVFSLGEQYLASVFVKQDGNGFVDRPIPLELVRCDPQYDETACGLVQLKHTVPPDLMYSSYWYYSGVNKSMTEHLNGIAHRAETNFQLGKDDVVLDIGCNDGTLLLGYNTQGVRRVGFEPSENISKVAAARNLEIISDFFNANAFLHRYPGEKCKIITSIAMFYDLENPHQFVHDIAQILHEDGVWIGEMSYLPLMLNTNSFDTICHEHLEYYHLAPLTTLFAAHGLRIVDVEQNDTNGGSLRFYARHSKHSYFSPQARERINAMRKREFELALDKGAPFEIFRRNCERIKTDLNALINRLILDHKTIYLYGASTKGNTLLQYCGIANDRIIAAAERNPVKYGLKTPGTNIPIISEEEARKRKPDYMLVLPWHFLDEFMVREAEYLLSGGKFIVPLPEVRVLGASDLEKWKPKKAA